MKSFSCIIVICLVRYFYTETVLQGDMRETQLVRRTHTAPLLKVMHSCHRVAHLG